MMPLLKKIDRLLFGRLIDSYARLLEREILPSCESLLDVGCGSLSPIYPFSSKINYTMGVDGFAPSIEKSKALHIHKDYTLMNILELDKHFEPKSYDCVIASDLIEHLHKKDGLKLLENMERIARKKVIVFTPNGFLPQSEYDGNVYQIHHSGWEIGEMQKFGYRVIGVGGWKPLRGERSEPRWKPTPLWARISFLTQPFTTKNPKHAFQILCIKDMR